MKTYITIDIGGTMIKYGLVNHKGEFLVKAEIPTEAEYGGPGIMKKVCGIIDEFIEKKDIAGICLSSAGMVDTEKGEIFYSGPTIPNYEGTNYKHTLEEKYGIPCEIENDVNCAGLAEVVSGNAKGSKITLCLTVGTGIGGALLLDTNVFHGYSNSACEVGYLPMGGKDFQQLTSTTTLVQNVANAHGDEVSSWNGRRVFEEAQLGNQKCINAIDQMVDYLGKGIATISYVINPETVVLGGGIMGQENYLRDKVETAIEKYLVTNISENLKVAFAHHKNDAGMLGAFYHFMNCHTEKR